MQWIKNQGMEFMNGKMDGFTKEIFKMILEMVLESSMMEIKLFIGDFGKMGNKRIQTETLLGKPHQGQTQACR